MVLHQNWNKSFSSHVNKILRPKTYDELREIVLTTPSFRVTGPAKHTFSEISLGEEVIIDTRNLNQLISLNEETVRVQAGMSLRRLNSLLSSSSVALENMGGADFQSIGGLLATATHGSGWKIPSSLSSLVSSLLVMDTKGNLHSISSSDEDFLAFFCSLGACGIILEVEFYLKPNFAIRESYLDFSSLLSSELLLNEVFMHLETSDYFEMNYFPEVNALIAKIRHQTEILPEHTTCWAKFKDLANDEIVTRFSALSSSRCITSHEEIVRFKQRIAARTLLSSNSTKEARQAFIRNDLHSSNITNVTDQEYAIPISQIPEALEIVSKWSSKHLSEGYVIVASFRFDKGSNSLLGPSAGRETCYVSCPILDRNIRQKDLETEFFEIGGRPHWGKWNEMNKVNVIQLYGEENLQKFLEISSRYDPERKGWNNYLRRALL